MNNFKICGSCHTLITGVISEDLCPRCGESVDPTFQDVLKRFIEYGVYATKKGVPLSEAQSAAQKALDYIGDLESKISDGS